MHQKHTLFSLFMTLSLSSAAFAAQPAGDNPDGRNTPGHVNITTTQVQASVQPPADETKAQKRARLREEAEASFAQREAAHARYAQAEALLQQENDPLMHLQTMLDAQHKHAKKLENDIHQLEAEISHLEINMKPLVDAYQEAIIRKNKINVDADSLIQDLSFTPMTIAHANLKKEINDSRNAEIAKIDAERNGGNPEQNLGNARKKLEDKRAALSRTNDTIAQKTQDLSTAIKRKSDIEQFGEDAVERADLLTALQKKVNYRLNLITELQTAQAEHQTVTTEYDKALGAYKVIVSHLKSKRITEEKALLTEFALTHLGNSNPPQFKIKHDELISKYGADIDEAQKHLSDKLAIKSASDQKVSRIKSCIGITKTNCELRKKVMAAAIKTASNDMEMVCKIISVAKEAFPDDPAAQGLAFPKTVQSKLFPEYDRIMKLKLKRPTPPYSQYYQFIEQQPLYNMP